MHAKPVSWTKLSEGTPDRELARLATIAKNDTIDGGSLAMLMAADAAEAGSPLADEMDQCVRAVYSRSTGKPDPDWSAWECDECGGVYLGADAAGMCCGDTWLDELEESEDGYVEIED